MYIYVYTLDTLYDIYIYNIYKYIHMYIYLYIIAPECIPSA